MANKAISGIPTKVVSNPSISRDAGTHKLVAKWKVGSALTTPTSSTRATSLDIVWTMRYMSGGKVRTATKTIKSRAVGTTTASFNPLNFTDDKNRKWSASSFNPNTKATLESVSFIVYGRNSKGRAKRGAGKSFNWSAPGAPTITPLEHDRETGEVRFEITAYDGSKDHRPRTRTDYTITVEDTRKSGAARSVTVPTNPPGTFNGDSKKWDENVSDKVVIDVTDRYLLSYEQYVKVTVSSKSQGPGGSSGNETKSLVVAYPNKPTIDASGITVDTKDARADMSGNVIFPIQTGSTPSKPTTRVKLQYVRSTDATTPSQATSEEWEDSTAIDDGECRGLAIPVATLSPIRGKHTWVRVKAWNLYEDLFVRYSDPVEVTQLYADPAVAGDNLVLLSLGSGDDGTSLIADFAWTENADPETGTEVSWSKDVHAWESTREPSTYETTRNDGPATVGGVSYAGTLRLFIQDLEQGTEYYVKGRRYLEPEEGDTSYGGYSNVMQAIPVSTPSSVSLSAPDTLAYGSDLALFWTYDSDATQTEWYLMYGNEYTVVDPLTGEREYDMVEGSWVASGNDAAGACVVPWGRISGLLDQNGEIGLAIRMGTGGSLVTSEVETLRVVEPPVLLLSMPATVTSQPVQMGFTSNVPARLSLVMRAGSLVGDGTALTGDNGGDGLVHEDQTAGDVIWQASPDLEWTASGGSYTTVVPTPSEAIELLDNGSYVLFAQATDPITGMVSDLIAAEFSVAWDVQAPRMVVDDVETPIRLRPSDTITGEGVRMRTCSIQLTAPSGAVGTETYNVYRVTPDGVYLIAERCGLEELVVDEYAPYGGTDTAYRVAVVNANGDIDWLDYDYSLPGRELRIDFGDTYVELPWNVSLSDSYKKDFEARQKLDGTIDGYWNDGVVRSGGYSSDLIRIMEQDKASLVRTLAQYAGPVFVRTPDGCAYQANVDVSSIGGARKDGALAVQLDATEVGLTDAFRATLPERESPDEEE